MAKIVRKSPLLPWVKPRTENKRRTRRANPSFYNKTAWRRLAKYCKSIEPFCQACKHVDNKTVIGEYSDHIIRIESGGAKLDQANIMTLCSTHHDSKSGQELHTPILIGWILNDREEKIPANRNDIFKIFKPTWNG